MKVLVLGAGMIGAATAFFSTRHGAEVVLVERAAPACAASGKASGFLALDWCDGLPRAALSRRGFALHAELAREAGDALGLRPVETLLVAARGEGASAAWLGAGFRILERLGDPTTTALVDTARLSRWLVERARAAGARLVIGTPEYLEPAGSGWRLRLAGTELEAEAVVLTLGPWTPIARAGVPLPPVRSLLGHSLRFELEEPLPPTVLFTRLDPARHGLDELEIYPRADGTPLLGQLPGRSGLWLATGHGPWGILEAPATGELLADLVLGREPQLDPRPFDPARPAARI